MQVESSGTQSATPGTEHNLATPATAKTRALVVDVAALVSGETVELRIYAPVLSGGTERLVQAATFAAAEPAPNTQAFPVLMPFGGRFTLRQTGGTGRSFPFSIITLD